MSISFDCNAVTGSANLVYSIDICRVLADRVNDYSNESLFTALCRTGCINYDKKWSCPPHSPNYRDFSAGWGYLFIFYARMGLAQFSYVKNDYMKIKAANTVLKSRVDKFLRQMASKYGKYISTGSCRLCKPCKRKTALPCAHPDLMTYSFEAMGVDVGKLVDEHFQKPLLWHETHCLPEYTSVVCGLLTNVDIDTNDLQGEYLRYIID